MLKRTLLPLALLFAALGAASAQDKVELGQLGQTTEAAKIHATASSRSKVYYSAKQYEYLVIKESSRKGWKRVLLQNGALGYIKEDVVAMLPYKVEGDAPKASSPVALRSSGKQTLASRSASAVAQQSLKFIGTPYKWGGNDLENGIDCSGFVKQLFGDIGVNLPRTAAEQVNVGKRITKLEDLRQGDRLYFWDKKRDKVGHTGIYLGNGYFVHSSSTNKGVATDHLGDPKWLKILVAARR